METAFKQKHDNMLMEILKENKSPILFLDSIFGFLSRRTDFYKEYDEDKRIGVPAEIRNQIVYKVKML